TPWNSSDYVNLAPIKRPDSDRPDGSEAIAVPNIMSSAWRYSIWDCDRQKGLGCVFVRRWGRLSRPLCR
ncbi:MAG: hypothetical protein F6K19_22985, partial [Cyanothece sp. SIO1E1]|nr:hypothetical protein [Cyanothece sp. SIO1E1]